MEHLRKKKSRIIEKNSQNNDRKPSILLGSVGIPGNGKVKVEATHNFEKNDRKRVVRILCFISISGKKKVKMEVTQNFGKNYRKRDARIVGSIGIPGKTKIKWKQLIPPPSVARLSVLFHYFLVD